MMNDEHFAEVTVGSSFIVYRLSFIFRILPSSRFSYLRF